MEKIGLDTGVVEQRVVGTYPILFADPSISAKVRVNRARLVEFRESTLADRMDGFDDSFFKSLLAGEFDLDPETLAVSVGRVFEVEFDDGFCAGQSCEVWVLPLEDVAFVYIFKT